jgi:hypothetical protein
VRRVRESVPATAGKTLGAIISQEAAIVSPDRAALEIFHLLRW